MGGAGQDYAGWSLGDEARGIKTTASEAPEHQKMIPTSRTTTLQP